YTKQNKCVILNTSNYPTIASDGPPPSFLRRGALDSDSYNLHTLHYLIPSPFSLQLLQYLMIFPLQPLPSY
ncbi:hypothetical protein M2137_001773, partial [Parabacteroides sp. PFB2-10]|uniref:hypothetical protein n=1 Tax=Parabacteroides sp. PFB2-10 TaxID=1742405 RepID=UPI00247654FC